MSKPKKSTTLERENKIAEYIKQNPKDIKIKDVVDYCGTTQISKKIISNVAAKLLIDITFADDSRHITKYEHHVWKFTRGDCVCDICRVCFRIYNRFKQNSIEISNEEVNILGNTFYKIYTEEKSIKKFYELIEKQLEILREQKKLEHKNDE